MFAAKCYHRRLPETDNHCSMSAVPICFIRYGVNRNGNLTIMSVVLFLIVSLCAASTDINYMDQAVAARLIWAAPGGDVTLPCDLSPPSDEDAVSMVLWFKDSEGMPLYSLDFRSGPLVHWAISDDLGGRSHFVYNVSAPHRAHLAITRVARADEGVFRCRVDFVDSPTKSYKTNLSVIVPPEQPKIFDAEGREVTVNAGPFREGYDLFLSCQVEGGRPPPEVTWWRGAQPLESLPELAAGRGRTLAQLFLSNVPRGMSGARLQCRARSTHLMPFLIKEVGLIIHLKPTRAWLKPVAFPIPAEHPTVFTCTVIGSKPPAKINWFLDSENIEGANVVVNNTGNSTVSTLTWRPRALDDGRRLVCRGANSYFPADTKQDEVTIYVAYAPILSLTIGSNDDPLQLKEDKDVQLICHSESKPPVVNYSWYKEDKQLDHDPAIGFLVLGRTLRITSLSKEDAGNYTCTATNIQGTTRSNAIEINILYRPRCAGGTVHTHIRGVPGVTLAARCAVVAPPPAAVGKLRFYWTYNYGRDVLPVPPSNISVDGATSTALHTPMGKPEESDLGTLACWAANSIGNQKSPCLFHIASADIPQPPLNCHISNSIQMEVICDEGFDGGIKQHFIMEVLEVYNKPTPAMDPNSDENEISALNDQAAWGIQTEPIFSLSGKSPHFKVQGLQAGRSYQFHIYAVNAKGRSNPPTTLEGIRIEKKLEKFENADHLQNSNEGVPVTTSIFGGNDNSMAMIFGAVMALVLLSLLTVLCVTVVIVCKRRLSRNHEMYEERADRSTAPSMYADPDGAFGLHFGVPTVIIRPNGGRRTSRIVSARLSGILDDNLCVVNEEQEVDVAVLSIPENELSDSSSSRFQNLQQETFIS